MSIAGSRMRCVGRMTMRPLRERGLVMLTLLIALLLLSVALMGALDVWSLQRRRETEKQLLFVGDQYRLAILRYYRAGRTLPASIDDLLNDTRVPIPLHHLRRAYADPVTGQNDWVLIYQAGRIGGLHSSSTDVPIKVAGFPRQYEDFEGTQSYADWQFFYLPPIHHNTSGADSTPRPGKRGSIDAPFDPMNNGLPGFTPRGLDTSQ